MRKPAIAIRMSSFTSLGIAASLEDMQPQVAHDHYSEGADDITAPNPHIVSEIEDFIEDHEAIDTDETVFNLLSDSNEALRRLDVIQMSVNYPMRASARMSNSTLLKADPGLESLVSTRTFTKSRLNAAIESNRFKFIKATVDAIIKFLKDTFAKAMAFFARFKKTKPEDVKKAVNKARETIKEDKEVKVDATKAQTMRKNTPLLLTQLKDKPASSGDKKQAPTPEPHVSTAKAADAFVSETEWKRMIPLLRGGLQHPDEVKALVNSANKLGGYLSDDFAKIKEFITQLGAVLQNGKVDITQSKEAGAVLASLLDTIYKHDQSGRRPAKLLAGEIQQLRVKGHPSDKAPSAQTVLDMCDNVMSIVSEMDIKVYENGYREAKEVVGMLKNFIDRVIKETASSDTEGVVLKILRSLQAKMSLISMMYTTATSVADIRRQASEHVRNINEFLDGVSD